MSDRVLAQEVMERLGRTGKVATWGWCELVTHPAASDLRDQYVSATALGIAMNLGPDGTGAYPSFRTLSQRLSISRKVVRRSAWALEAGGWLDAVGNGPKGTIRWCATVPVDVFRVMDNAYHGDGLPWVELLADEQTTDVIAASFVPVAAYVSESKRDRTDLHTDSTPVDPTTEATERPVDPATEATDMSGAGESRSDATVAPRAEATPKPAAKPVAPTTGPGVGDTVGTRTSRDPTTGSNEEGCKTRTCEADKCDRPVAVPACTEDPHWRDLCTSHASQIREWHRRKLSA